MGTGQPWDIPRRRKSSFGGARSALSKQIITEQVLDIAEHFLKEGVDFDEDNANWMVAPKFFLPKNWSHVADTTALLIAFPTEYPEIPPIGFYMMASLPLSPNGHLYPKAYHAAWHEPLAKGWNWYCVYIEPGNWRPAPVRRSGDWKRGDNLWTYFRLIQETLGSPD